MALSDSFLQELKMKTDIEDVISTYVTLKRRGATLVGLCPFHNEKTPSFTVYPATQSFYCFGCGAGGDAITFLKKIENLEEDINNKKAPKWAMEIDISRNEFINQCIDFALKNIDTDLVESVERKHNTNGRGGRSQIIPKLRTGFEEDEENQKKDEG